MPDPIIINFLSAADASNHSQEVHLVLSRRQVEQMMMETQYLQYDARVKGPILNEVYEALRTCEVTPAVYPGHPDTWPKDKR